jgi:hypothetical protein
MSRDVTAHARFLCNKTAMHKERIRGTLYNTSLRVSFRLFIVNLPRYLQILFHFDRIENLRKCSTLNADMCG